MPAPRTKGPPKCVTRRLPLSASTTEGGGYAEALGAGTRRSDQGSGRPDLPSLSLSLSLSVTPGGGSGFGSSVGKMAGDMFSQVLESQMLQTAKIVEEQLDAEIEKFDQMDEDELEILKQKRLEALKKAQQQKQEWLSKGHGEYREISSERDFFQEVKGSKNVVCHFYKDSTYRSLIFDKHLTILAKKHIETKFIKVNVEKSPFLCERLRIKVIPTLALVKDGKTQDYVVGFTDLGNTDDFTTETLEWRLGCAGIINYSGSLMDPPFQSQKKFGTSFTKLDKKIIRGKKYDSDSDDD